MYRKVYGNLEDCNGYIQDKNHKAIVWKTHPFCFILENKTQYMLEVRRKNGEFLGMIFPKRKKEILCKKWWDGEIKVIAKDIPQLNCQFCVESGVMVERSWTEKEENIQEYLVPIFKSGKVEIITCDNPEANFGKKTRYKEEPLLEGNLTMKVKIKNKAPYDVVLSMGDRILCEIKSKEEKVVLLPRNGVLYIDTELEEVEYVSNNLKEKKILRVNGCCIEIIDGKVFKNHSVQGVLPSEPYIRFLYACSESSLKEMDIYCWTIDWQLD